MMNNQEKQFAENLLKNCKTGDDWLAAMKFGLPTMIKDSAFLFEKIRAQAESIEAGEPETSIENLHKRIAFYCDELNLELKLSVSFKTSTRR